MNKLIANFQKDVPWCMLFVNDIVVINEKITRLKTKLHIGRKILKDKHFKTSRTTIIWNTNLVRMELRNDPDYDRLIRDATK